MKVLKGILFFLLGLILLLLILAGVFLGLTYEKVENPLDGNKEPRDLVTLMADDLKDSLNEIYVSNYENNNVTLEIPVDEINSYIVKEIRSNLNKDYLNGSNSIVGGFGFSLDSLYTFIENDAFAARALISGLGFYHTTVTLSATISVEGRNLLLQFDTFRLGKRLGIKKGLVLSIFNLMKLQTPDINGFDLDNLSYKLNIDKLINNLNINNDLFKALLDCSFDVRVGTNSIKLIANTKDLLNKGQEIDSYIDGVDVISKIESQGILDEYKFTLNNDELNTLIHSSISDSLLDTKLSIGGEEFNVKLDKFYFDLVKGEIKSNLFLDNVKTSVIISLDLKKMTNGNGDIVLLITPTSAKIGNYSFPKVSKLFNEVEINSKALGIDDKASIKDIVIDANRSIIEFSVAIN